MAKNTDDKKIKKIRYYYTLIDVDKATSYELDKILLDLGNMGYSVYPYFPETGLIKVVNVRSKCFLSGMNGFKKPSELIMSKKITEEYTYMYI